MTTPISLSIVLPVYNEQHIIAETICDSIEYLKKCSAVSSYELIAVDDGSQDSSADILKKLSKEIPDMSVVTHSENRGYGAALISGIRKAKHDYVLLMDADGQIRMNALDQVLPFIHDFDIVSGYRARRMDSLYRRFLGRTYTLIVRLLFGVQTRDINCGFKVFQKSYLDVDGINSHAGAFYTHIFVKARKMGARMKEVPIQHYPRQQGHSTGADWNVVSTAITDVIKLIFNKKS